MTTTAQRVAQRQQMEAQREVAQRILADLENPTPVVIRERTDAERTAIALEGLARRKLEMAASRSLAKAYLLSEIDLYSDPDDDGHQIWTGPTSRLSFGHFAPKQQGVHRLCGKGHYQAARGLYEEFLGRALDTYHEPVNRTCDESLCVAPAHHEVRAN